MSVFTPTSNQIAGTMWQVQISEGELKTVFCSAANNTSAAAIAAAMGTDVTQAQLDEIAQRERSTAVTAERDRRINGGFVFGGVAYQTRPEDLENIAGAATSALAAITSGAQPGDYRWHGGSDDFAWIAANNSFVAMDAQTVFAFGQAAMAHKQAHIFAARSLKDSGTIPADFADDAHWP